MRERKIPKPGGSGKVRKLGIPGIADRVVQAALKLVLEPIFEADFEPVSYGFRPKRRAHDAIAEIHHFGTRGYRWVLDADIEAAFDNLSHSFAMERVRARVKDKRVLALVKTFLKSGVLTELGEHRETLTGTPQGGILSPLIFNIALSALDEHVMEPWKPGGVMSTLGKRSYRRSRADPNFRDPRINRDLMHDMRMPPYMRDEMFTALGLTRRQYEDIIGYLDSIAARGAAPPDADGGRGSKRSADRSDGLGGVHTAPARRRRAAATDRRADTVIGGCATSSCHHGARAHGSGRHRTGGPTGPPRSPEIPWYHLIDADSPLVFLVESSALFEIPPRGGRTGPP